MECHSHRLWLITYQRLISKRTNEHSQDLSVLHIFFDHLVALIDTFFL